ncbi:MAG: AI-2E family transporter [Acidimicrobiia bacterium]
MSEPSPLYERFRRLGIASWSVVGVLLVAAVAIWIAIQLRIILLPLILAIGIIYLINPFVDLLSRTRVPRILGTVLVYIVFIGLLVLAGVAIYPMVRDQVVTFIAQVPDIATDLTAEIVRIATNLGITVDLPTIESIQEWLADPANREQIIEALGQVSEVGLAVFEVIGIFLLAPILALYLLIDLPAIKERATGLLPPASREEAIFLGRELGRALGGFVRGQLVVALFVGVASSIGLRIIDHPFWLVIGLIAGVLNLVPFIGPISGGILAAATAIAVQDFSTAIWSVVVMVIVQQIDNHLISPIVLRVAVKLSPVTIILALIAGGALFGLFGVLIAVPTVAAVKVLLGHLWRTRILGESWEEASEAMIVTYEPPARLVRRGRSSPEQLTLDSSEDEEAPDEAAEA